MLKKHLPLFLIALGCALALTACGSDDKNSVYIPDDKWQADNEKVIADIKANPEYKELKSQTNAGSIYYKVLEPKSPTHGAKDSIYYTSEVKVYYYGMAMNETGRKIDLLFDSADHPLQETRTFNVNGVVDGFSTALQNMLPGDRWEIWIPWQLGYGASGNRSTTGQSSRPWAYSTLMFEVEVVEVIAQ